MAKLEPIIAAHPLQENPYDKITYTRVDGNQTPLYRVSGLHKDTGAQEALMAAFKRFGGRCFHCEVVLRPQKLSKDVTRDHLQPLSKGGCNYLHNLVISCGKCNRDKAARDLIEFKVERGDKYLKALDAHIVRCIQSLDNRKAEP